MVHHWISRRRDSKPDFPERLDLPYLTDSEASAALCLLRLLVQAGAADVYTQPLADRVTGRWRWNVWLGHQIKPGGERIELQEWAARALRVPYRPEGGAA
jgi:hypothetical protein